MAGDRPIERLGTVALLALTGMLPAGVSTRALPRPDLAETAGLVSQRTVQAGGSLRVTDVVRNRGTATAARSTTGYYVSRQRSHQLGNLRLRGPAIRRPRPG